MSPTNSEIAALDGEGRIPAYVARPDAATTRAIIVIPEIFGVNEGIRKKADDWAALGYLAIAPDIQDKVLHADADMNAADWKTGVAGILGIIGISMGFWWADAVAAGLIGLDVLKDGWRNLRISVAELLDGAPRKLGSAERQHLADRVQKGIDGAPVVKLREAGRYLHVVIGDDDELLPDPERAKELVGEDDAWRVVTLSVKPDT